VLESPTALEVEAVRYAIALVFLVLLPTTGFSSSIWVPDDHPTIQAAIDAAAGGDEVVVRPGTYVENIDFLGKAITVRSALGPDVTIIDGGAAGSVVVFDSGEGPGSVLDGFTLTNGTGTVDPWWSLAGGGIYCESSSPTITNNVITGNTADGGGGGGIKCYTASPTITNNVITGNSALAGGGINDYGSSATFMYNTVSGNWANHDGGGICCGFSSSIITSNIITGNTACVFDGGGIALLYSDLTIANNTISQNAAPHVGHGGGIYGWESYATITNTIVWDNHATTGPEIYRDTGTLTVTYSCVKGGWAGTGNIDADPLWVDPVDGDFRLQQDPCQPGVRNPCVDAGDPLSPMVGGTTRTDWVQDNGIVDMGCHYAIPSASAAFRNAGSNPASYTTTLPVLGTTLIGMVDLAGTSGHDIAWLVGFAAPLSMTLSGGQVLLVDAFHSWGELLDQPPLPGPTATFYFGIPSWPSLLGFPFSAQALHIGGVIPYAFSNAQDFVIGH